MSDKQLRKMAHEAREDAGIAIAYTGDALRRYADAIDGLLDRLARAEARITALRTVLIEVSRQHECEVGKSALVADDKLARETQENSS